ncbi:MAG: T9SS type A sorting domain-containing protein [Flavobacteriales bacterium]|nr:T9SS type A sorting domain-containing protein [Flavobacteriales bacterium]
MRIWITTFAVTLCSVAKPQGNWADAGMPQMQSPANWIYDLYVDTAEAAMYVCGHVQVAGGQWGLMKYSQGQWDTLGLFNYVVKTVVRWQDTLIVGGSFTTVDGAPLSKVACYANGLWLPFGDISNGTINKLSALGNVLYAVGGFDYADGHFCNGVAKRVGNEWVNLGTVPGMTSNTQIMDIALFQDEPYACGSLNLPDGTKGIMRFNGTDWVAVGPGVLGGFSGLRALAVYNGELYGGGSVRVTDGNAGHGIMRWDGSQWHEVGGHLQDAYCGYSFSAPVYDMVVHDNKLFVVGGIGCAGGVPAQRIAIWDGTKWCGMGTSFPMSATTTSIAFLQDTLYVAVAPGNIIDGLTVNGVAKWIGGAYADTCSVPVGMSEVSHMHPGLVVHDLGGGVFEVSGLPATERSIAIHDAMGRLVRHIPLASGQGSVRIDLSGQPPGIYLLQGTRKGYSGKVLHRGSW